MLILLTGGSASGKSHYAEALCLKMPSPRYYIAAMRPRGASDKESIARKRQIRKQRGFTDTFDRYTDLAALKLPQQGAAMLECLCHLTANEMFNCDGTHSDPVQTVLNGVAALRHQCSHLLVITNDVGNDSRSYDATTNEYVQALGQINALLAQQADCVYELVCGIPILLKGKEPFV